MPDMERLRSWVIANEEKKEGAAMEKRGSSAARELEEAILVELAEEGVPSMKVTVERPPSETDRERVKLALLMEDVEVPADKIDAITRRLYEKPTITRTVFVGSRIWANPKITEEGRDKANDEEYERACRALEANGYGEYVQERFNVISLSSAVKEAVENGEIELGEVFDGTIVVKEKFQLNARAAK